MMSKKFLYLNIVFGIFYIFFCIFQMFYAPFNRWTIICSYFNNIVFSVILIVEMLTILQDIKFKEFYTKLFKEHLNK
jgi:hypothetical protein